MKDYIYKVVEFSRIKNSNTGKIDSAVMIVECSCDGIVRSHTSGLYRSEIEEYEQDPAYANTIAERVSAEGKIELDRQISESETVIEKSSPEDLAAISVDPEKVK